MTHYLDPNDPEKTLCGQPFVYGTTKVDPNLVTCPKCARKLDVLLASIPDDVTDA